MKNRAKCKLCNEIIESFHPTDYVICKCGEIAVDGGDAMRCYAKSFENFLRVDDEGNEIIVRVESKSDDVKRLYIENTTPTKKDLLMMLEDMHQCYQKLPEVAKQAYVTNYDLESVLGLVLSIFRAEF
jgi:hypothetical protein